MSEEVNHKVNIAFAIIFAAIFLGVLLLALVIVTSVVNVAAPSVSSPITTTIANETGYANSTGYTLAASLIQYASSPAIVTVYNSTTLLTSGNYSLSGWIIKNATSQTWNDITITYTYQNPTTAGNLTTANVQVKDSVIGMVINFFALMPIVGTILAVTILIFVIVLLVIYVRKMAHSENTSGFQG